VARDSPNEAVAVSDLAIQRFRCRSSRRPRALRDHRLPADIAARRAPTGAHRMSSAFTRRAT
jgi:hypothetical protein